MSSSGIAPCSRSGCKIGLMSVHDTGNGKLGHGLGLLYKLDVRTDDAEMIAQIDEGNLNAVPCHSVKYKSCGILLAADAQGMNLDLGLCGRKCGRNLKHMGCKLQLASLIFMRTEERALIL